jgi:hypothetical protein
LWSILGFQENYKNWIIRYPERRLGFCYSLFIFHRLFIISCFIDILTQAIYYYFFCLRDYYPLLGFYLIFVYKQLNIEYTNLSTSLFPIRFWLWFTGSIAYSIQEHVGAYSMWEFCASCMGVSRYQLVRYGWGAMLPATLYPAIYIYGLRPYISWYNQSHFNKYLCIRALPFFTIRISLSREAIVSPRV